MLGPEGYRGRYSKVLGTKGYSWTVLKGTVTLLKGTVTVEGYSGGADAYSGVTEEYSDDTGYSDGTKGYRGDTEGYRGNIEGYRGDTDGYSSLVFLCNRISEGSISELHKIISVHNMRVMPHKCFIGKESRVLTSFLLGKKKKYPSKPIILYPSYKSHSSIAYQGRYVRASREGKHCLAPAVL